MKIYRPWMDKTNRKRETYIHIFPGLDLKEEAQKNSQLRRMKRQSDGSVAPEDLALLKEACLVVPSGDKTIDLFGDFLSFQPGGFAVSSRLRRAIQEISNDDCEFFEVENFRVADDAVPYEGEPFYYCNVKAEADFVNWNHTKKDEVKNRATGEILKVKIFDVFPTVYPEKVPDRLIWRDSVTDTIFVSNKFKNLTKKFVTHGLRFKDVTMRSD